VLFIVTPDLLDHLRAAFSPNSPISYDRRFDEVRTASFLVLDDLGTQSANPLGARKTLSDLNFRYPPRASDRPDDFAAARRNGAALALAHGGMFRAAT